MSASIATPVGMNILVRAPIVKTANPKGQFGYQTVVLIQKGAKVDAFQVITG